MVLYGKMNFKIENMITIVSLMSILLLSACTQGIADVVKENDGAGRTGVVVSERNSVNETVTYMKIDLKFAAAENSGTTPAERVLVFLRAHRKTLLIRNPDEEFRVVSVQKDNLGYTRVRLDQHVQGLPVWDGNIALHFKPEGTLYLFRGEYFPTSAEVDLHAGLKGEPLLEKVSDENPSLSGIANYTVDQQWIYFVDDKHPVLARELKSPSQLMPTDNYIVDAVTGKLLNRLPNVIQTQNNP